MLKASALYLVIVIALVIGVLCSSLITAAYFYRADYQKRMRYDRLENNLNSGINILLANNDSLYSKETTFNLFDEDYADSVSLQKFRWGVYTISTVKSFIQKDTLFKVFSIANTVDSSKWGALYLRDEDRPISLSGKTMIRGDAYLPKSGIQKAYIDGKAYDGSDKLVIGKKKKSEKTLPSLDTVKLKLLYTNFTLSGIALPTKDSITRSFLQPTMILDLKKHPQSLTHIYLNGNIILRSDTTVTIDSSVKLDNVLVFAKAIIVKNGFNGNCQLFATDSIKVGSDCNFEYPSTLGIVRFERMKGNSQAKIRLGENSVLAGLLFTYEQKPSDLKPTIIIGKKDTIKGQVYSQDVLELKDGCEIDGNIFTGRFLYRSSFTLYENYLINARLDQTSLSSYFLTSSFSPVASKNKKILRWLEGH